MDYRLSYTRDDTPYDADQEFLDAILRLNRESRLKVLVQIEKSSEFFYRTHRDFTFEEEYDVHDYFLRACGVVNCPEPMFYMVSYYSDGESSPVLLDIEVVDSDTYLDYVSKGEVLKEINDNR